MKVDSARTLLLVIAVICFIVAAIGIGFGTISFLPIGLVAFAGAELVDELR